MTHHFLASIAPRSPLRFVASLVLMSTLVASVANAAPGSAPSAQPGSSQEDKRRCIDSAELGQRLRQLGKLQEALVEFRSCASPSCPVTVRTDCAAWATQIENAPTLVVVARDSNGDDLADVRVFLDGSLWLESIDGRAAPIGVGEHVIRFEHRGVAPIEKKILVHEGDRARRLEVAFASSSAAPPSSASAAPAPSSGAQIPDEPTDRAKTSHSRIAPIVVMAIGGVAVLSGVIMVVQGNSMFPPGCSNGTCVNYYDDNTPVPTASSPGVNLPVCSTTNNQPINPAPNGCARTQKNQDRQRDAGQADGFKTLGTIVAVSGGVVAVGGLVWFLLSPSSEEKRPESTSFLRDFTLAPLLSTQTAGASAAIRF